MDCEMCYPVLRIHPRSVTAAEIAFADDMLTINVPQRSFDSGKRYYLRIEEPIPAETTIGAAVVLTIGDGTVEYPLLDCNGTPITAERIRSGYRYTIELVGTPANGAFRVTGPLWYWRGNEAFSVDGTDPAAEEGGGAA